MRKFFFSIICLIFLLSGTSCKKKATQFLEKKTVIQLFNGGEEVYPILKEEFPEKIVKSFYKELDESALKRLANQIKQNKDLSRYLKSNDEAIKIWNFLSKSEYVENINALKYFEELPSKGFLLRSHKNIDGIYDARSRVLLAKVEKDAIVITKFNDNAFANLNHFVPGAVYKIKNIEYTTDNLGRVGSVNIPLLRLSKPIPTDYSSKNLLISPHFGGSNLRLNTISNSNNGFSKLNATWTNTLESRGKISNLQIKKIYNSNDNIPDGYNVFYYSGKKRVIRHVQNKSNEANDIYEKLKRSAKGTHIDGSTAIKRFPEEITVEQNKLIYKNKQFGNVDVKNKVIYIDRRAALTKKNINPFLDHPKLLPNYRYVVKDGVNEHIFRTDKFERVIYSEHRLLVKYSKNRNVVSQNNAKLYGDENSSKTLVKGLTNSQHRKLSDEGGHYLADSAGGIPESINITSQAYRVNHSVKWRRMEQEISKALEKGDNVLVKNRQFYNDNSRRPSGSIYEVIINGKTKKFQFDNTNFTMKDI